MNLFQTDMLICSAVIDGVSKHGSNNEPISELADQLGRSLMGPKQEAWLYKELSESQHRNATWRILGNQVGKLVVISV